MAATIHFALMFCSVASYENEIETLSLERKGSVGDWQYVATVGRLPEEVRHAVAVIPSALHVLLNTFTGQSQVEDSDRDDPLTRRDRAIDAAAAAFQFDHPWGDQNHLYTCVEVRKEVEIEPDALRGDCRYFWFNMPQAEKAVRDTQSLGSQAAQAVLAALLPQLHESLFAYTWPRDVRWVSLPGKPVCPIPIVRFGEPTAWVSPNATRLAEQIHKVALPSTMSAKSIGKLATLGRWRVVAAAEPDNFRRFLWCFAGLEVVSRWIASLVQDEILARLSDPGAHVPVMKELFWPTTDDGREPQRNLVANFAAMALVLSPETAAQDVATIRELSKYRNGIHGGSLDPDAAPAGKAAALWQRYSALAAERLA